MVAALATGMLPAATADEPADRRPDVPADVFYADADGASVTHRSDELVARWVRAGGLDRRAVVIAVPTGSGWVDEAAVHGYRERFAGDVAVLAMQYSARPSWQTFVADRAAAGRTTITLLRAVLHRTGTRPPPQRPQIHIYGQSLGAVGAEAARSWADRTHPGDLAETVLVGVPGDSVARRPGIGSRRIIVANRTDPIPRWSVSLLWRPSRPPHDTRAVGRDAPQPPWLPLIGFLQTSADLLGALDGAPGVGHRYGLEQGTGSLSS